MGNQNGRKKTAARRSSPGKKQTTKTSSLTALRLKIGLIMFMILGSIAYLSYQIYYIKATFGEKYENRAIMQLLQRNSANEQLITPNRGSILDRNKDNFLAQSVKTYLVFLDLKVLVNQSEEVQENSIRGLSEVIGKPYEELMTLLDYTVTTDSDGNETKSPVITDSPAYHVVQRDLSHEQALEIEELNLRCVYLEEGTKRVYPDDSLASSTVGFIRGDSSWGLERLYDSYLTGTPGRIYREFTDGSAELPTRVEAQDGNTLVTTIDNYLQSISEDIAKKHSDKYQSQQASVIIMNPKTGEIYAMASYPSFDLNSPDDVSKITKESLALEWQGLDKDNQLKLLDGIWKNFNVSSTLEPGSIFKPLVVAAALEENIITPETRFNCSGVKQVEDFEIPCGKRTGHGNISLTEAIAQSCNIALMDIAEAMGRSKFYTYQRDFGFGQKTGIDLPAEESASSLIYSLTALNPVELATSSFGQRFNCTPIQIITAFASLINGGNLMKPYIVSRVLDEDNNLVFENQPTIIRKVLSKETSDYMKTAMIDVISPTGTGRNAYIEGYSIGGKTGTAEQGLKDTPGYHHCVSIMGYLPADDPEFLVLTLIENPKDFEDGVTSASPMLREVMAELIRYKNIQPDSGNEDMAALTARTELVTVPNLVNMPLKEAIVQLNLMGLDYKLIGNAGSKVTVQYPQAGDKVSKSTVIICTISSEGTETLKSVPDVNGMNLYDAKQLIIASGFEPSIFYDTQLSTDGEIVSDDEQADDVDDLNDYEVYMQIPDKNVIVPEGSQIKIKARLRDPQ